MANRNGLIVESQANKIDTVTDYVKGIRAESNQIVFYNGVNEDLLAIPIMEGSLNSFALAQPNSNVKITGVIGNVDYADMVLEVLQKANTYGYGDTVNYVGGFFLTVFANTTIHFRIEDSQGELASKTAIGALGRSKSTGDWTLIDSVISKVADEDFEIENVTIDIDAIILVWADNYTAT